MSLTIKQAFEALSDACANGMKNPFFVMRRLKESFADVASKVVDASGDKVTVTQTLTEGTQIGSIKVNNATTALYAPAGGGADYSTTEQKIGTWIDGSDVYEKTTSTGAITAGSTIALDLGIGTGVVDTVIDFTLMVQTGTTSWNKMPISLPSNTSVYESYIDGYNSSTDKLTVITGSYASYSASYVTIRYTKSST